MQLTSALGQCSAPSLAMHCPYESHMHCKNTWVILCDPYAESAMLYPDMGRIDWVIMEDCLKV